MSETVPGPLPGCTVFVAAKRFDVPGEDSWAEQQFGAEAGSTVLKCTILNRVGTRWKLHVHYDRDCYTVEAAAFIHDPARCSLCSRELAQGGQDVTAGTAPAEATSSARPADGDLLAEEEDLDDDNDDDLPLGQFVRNPRIPPRPVDPPQAPPPTEDAEPFGDSAAQTAAQQAPAGRRAARRAVVRAGAAMSAALGALAEVDDPLEEEASESDSDDDSESSDEEEEVPEAARAGRGRGAARGGRGGRGGGRGRRARSRPIELALCVQLSTSKASPMSSASHKHSWSVAERLLGEVAGVAGVSVARCCSGKLWHRTVQVAPISA